jgi:uncharacterized protein (TIGR03437 family)
MTFKNRTALSLLLLGACPFGWAQQYTISTYAGGAPPPTPIAGVQASIGLPSGVAADGAGNAYFSALNCVFKLDSNGVMTRVAGNSRAGFSGEGGSATSAQLNTPFGVAVDASGNIYIAEASNNRIRKVSATGIITTVAGNGTQGYSGDGGPATNAQLYNPFGVAVDASGNIYIAEASNNRIRKVSAAEIITTVAGNGAQGYSGDGGLATSAQLATPTGVAVDASGNVYIADRGNNRIRKVSANGIITTVAGNGSSAYFGDGGSATSAELYNPSGVAVDASGNLYIADYGNQRIRKVSAAGIITTVAGNGSQGYPGDGGPATSAELYNPSGVVVNTSGSVYIADTSNSRIRKVSAAGIITTVAGNGAEGYSGDGGPATSAQLFYPSGVALDASGNLYIADQNNNRIRKVSATGIITTVAGNGAEGYSGDGGSATSAQLNVPFGVAVDASGNIYIADSNNNRIRKVSATGIITTVAGNGAQGYSGDGGSATSAQLNFPYGVAVDASGNLYIADKFNERVRRVSATGIITTVAGNGAQGYSGDGGLATSSQLNTPIGVAVDASGNLYIADEINERIRKVSAAGIITTVAGNGALGYSGDGGLATSAQLATPTGVAVDASGNLYVADYNNSRVRKVSAAGIITTMAGKGTNGAFGYAGDGGPATSAQLAIPTGVALDASANLYLADSLNNAIRLLTPSISTCELSVSPTSFQSPASGGSLMLAITTAAGCAWTVSNLPDWITLSGSATGSGLATITLIVALNSGAPRSVQISVAGINVTVNQASNILLITTGGVVNGASYTAPVAPGSIAAIFGNFLLPAPLSIASFPIPLSLGGLSFQFGGGFLAPLFYANFGQVNGQVPWELAGQSQTTITANNGQTSAPVAVNLGTYAPGIFAVNGEGTGQGAILDASNRLVDSTNPATAGRTVVQIFCTGLGPVTNQPATGAASPTDPLARTATQPTVMIGGVPASVQFSGLTPSSVGLYQVNALVPVGAAKGSAAPVVISIGAVQSNTVTIAVQ